jgi:DNA-binding MarR family transcriptional regulator
MGFGHLRRLSVSQAAELRPDQSAEAARSILGQPLPEQRHCPRHMRSAPIYIDYRCISWYASRVEQPDRAVSEDDVAEGLEQAAILTVRHLSDRAALNLTAVLTLGTLDQEGPVRVTTLAAAAGIGQPSMTQLIQRLERQGLVTRVDDPEDGRVALVSLSDAGRALRADHRRERRNRLAMLIAALPAEDEAALNLAMHVALPIIRRLVDQAHRSPISTVDRTLDTPSRT